MFSTLTIANWRQFARVRIAFHPRLTVLTGANGSGKTTILHLLNRHWGWNLQYVSTPRWDRKGVRKYWAGFWEIEESDVSQPVVAQRRIGRLEYGNQQSSDLTIPENVSEVFGVSFANQQQVKEPLHKSAPHAS